MRALALAFILLSSASAAELCEAPSPIDTIQIEKFVNDVGEAIFSEEELKDCSWEKQLRYNGSLRRVRDRIDKLASEVEAYDTGQLAPRERRQVKKVKETLSCVRNGLIDEVSFRCHQLFGSGGKCQSHTRTYVEGNGKSFLGIKIKEEFPKKEIHVCAEKLEGLDEAFRDAVIMHELTHFCGVENEDEKYFLSPYQYRPPKRNLIETGMKMATNTLIGISFRFAFLAWTAMVTSRKKIRRRE